MIGKHASDSHSFVAERAWSVVAGATAEVARFIGALYLVDLCIRTAAASALGALLSDQEQSRAARFHHEIDRLRYVAGRARLRQCLALSLGIRPGEIQLKYGPYGKPRLSDIHESSLQFNLSHSGGWGLIGVAQDRAIGVDIEEMVSLTDMDDLAIQLLPEHEYATYRAASRKYRAGVFYDCWTRKEAFAKAIGNGLSVALKYLDAPTVRQEWHCVGFCPSPGLAAAAAISASEPFVAVVAAG